MIHKLRRAGQAHSGTTDATRTERGIHTAGNREIAGQWLFRWAGTGSLSNRSLLQSMIGPDVGRHRVSASGVVSNDESPRWQLPSSAAVSRPVEREHG